MNPNTPPQNGSQVGNEVVPPYAAAMPKASAPTNPQQPMPQTQVPVAQQAPAEPSPMFAATLAPTQAPIANNQQPPATMVKPEPHKQKMNWKIVVVAVVVAGALAYAAFLAFGKSA